MFPLKIGPLLLQENMLLLLVAGLAGFLALYIRTKGTSIGSLARDTYGSMVLYGLLVWKLSYILFHPVSVIENPLSVLYFSGGFFGILLALVCIGLWIWYAHAVPVSLWILSGMSFLAAYKFLSFLLHLDIRPFLQSTMAVAFLILLWRNEQKSFVAAYLCILSQFFISLFTDSPFLFGLSKEQLLYLAITMVALILERRKH